MFSTGFPQILAVLLASVALIGAAVALFYARKCAFYSHQIAKFTSERAPRRRIAEISGEMSDLRDAYDSLLQSHKKLRSRITMRQNRAKKENGAQDSLDLSTSVEKDRLRLACRERGLLK